MIHTYTESKRSLCCHYKRINHRMRISCIAIFTLDSSSSSFFDLPEIPPGTRITPPNLAVSKEDAVTDRRAQYEDVMARVGALLEDEDDWVAAMATVGCESGSWLIFSQQRSTLIVWPRRHRPRVLRKGDRRNRCLRRDSLFCTQT